MRRFSITRAGPGGDRGRGRSGRLCGLLIGLALVTLGGEGQAAPPFDEAGRFYVRNFGPEDYDAHAQNWAVVQSPEGLLYVGNNDGVLEYDGVTWRLIPVANRSVVRSLTVDVEGRVVVGATGELGYLAPDALGRTQPPSASCRTPRSTASSRRDRGVASPWTKTPRDACVSPAVGPRR